MKRQIISDDASYSFSDYFKLNFYIEDILAHFGYSFQIQDSILPKSGQDLSRIDELKTRIKESLPYISLSNETARREFLIAPILLELVQYTHAAIKVEYPMQVNEQLKGTLDYYLQSKNNLLIIEAKNADLQHGFVQLAVELIALDKWTEKQSKQLYGAVSDGVVWQFGILDRQAKHIVQDFNLYRVPADLEELTQILIAILTREDEKNRVSQSKI